MGISPLSFVGISKFSEDFQTIMSRAVAIAELPVKALQNRTVDVLSKKTLFSGLSTATSALATSLKSLGKTASEKALSASSSDSTIVSVTNAGASVATAYTIDSIASLATAASERTSISYADSAATPVSASGSLKLVIGDDEHEITLTNNSLVGLRDALNGLGAGVSASILTTSEGNYLSVTSNTLGETTLELIDDPEGTPANLLTSANQGSDAVFELNGIEVSQTSNIVNSVVPGLTFTLLKESDDPVTLSLATSRTKLQTGLQDFVNKYNAARDQVSAQVGPNAGLLTGNHVVGQLQGVLRGIASYRNDGASVNSLTALGIEFSNTGVASLNTNTFSALSEAQINQAFDLIGTETSGLGGFSETLTQYTDPISGLIQEEQNGLDRVDVQLNKQIEQMTTRIEVMRLGLAKKLQQADALLASLESQQNTVKASLESLNMVLYGKREG